MTRPGIEPWSPGPYGEHSNHYAYGSSFNKQGKILLKKLAIGSTIYSCAFFKEINSYESFHVVRHCKDDLIY